MANQSIGKQIQERREQLNMNSAQLAQKSGMNLDWLLMVETDRWFSVTLVGLDNIARALSCQIVSEKSSLQLVPNA